LRGLNAEDIRDSRYARGEARPNNFGKIRAPGWIVVSYRISIWSSRRSQY
jgi:hypothetical protein